MKFTLPVALGALLAVVAVGVGGLIASPIPMATRTILMMVAPSMLVFGLLAFGLGVKHGEFRAA
ncbi:DUF7333 family protein [Natronomonas marina]|jgi:hypothetical protein|uniref:DUF7333 family protein n=1 Tax=Natronomonas marina TaxID=2961939 RepID=UPI0020C966B9|nr:hypothetical protein [Natronomonas marina]